MIRQNLVAVSRNQLRRPMISVVQLASTGLLYSTQTPRPTNSSSSDSSKKSKSKWGFGWRKWTVAAVALGSGYAIGTSNYNHFGPKKSAEDVERELETVPEYRYIYHHPYVQQLRSETVKDEAGKEHKKWKEGRYYDTIPTLHRGHMLTSGLLKGPGYLTVEPLVFQDVESKGEIVIFYHVGDKLDGHDGIVHGGFLATIMDEGLTRCGFPRLPNKYGVTGTLELNYRSPTPSNSYIMLKGQVDNVKGRRAVAKGKLQTLPKYHVDGNSNSILDEEPRLLVESEILVVEPKWAKYFTWLI